MMEARFFTELEEKPIELAPAHPNKRIKLNADMTIEYLEGVEMIEEGIYPDLLSEHYHGDKESISRSSLLDFKKSPYYYWSKHINVGRPVVETTPALEFGNAFHTLILEPHLFDAKYYVEPEKTLLRQLGKEKYEAYKKEKQDAEERGKSVLSLADYYKLRAMQTAIVENEKSKELLEGALYEHSYFWRDKESGLMLKSRPDILHSFIYVDLKTCDDASPSAFQKSMGAYGYHLQAAMVVDGVKALAGQEIEACINICVEKKYPYAVGIYIIDEAAIQVGREEYKRLAYDLSISLKTNQFPSYQIEVVSLPRWYV